MVCKNPVNDRVFVLHSRAPFILAEALHFADEKEWMEAQKQFEIGSRLEMPDGELIILGCIWMVPDGKKADAQKEADNIAGIMRRMADWYKSYLIQTK